MNIEPKNIIYIISPFVLIGIAWGTSTATINDLKKEQELMKAQVMEVEIRYIKDQVNKNSNKLDTILEKMK